jgi:protein phosphatase
VSELIPGTEYGPPDGLGYEHSWQCTTLDINLLSDVGMKRKNNEDSCIMCVPKNPNLAETRGILIAVADGMGGASAGEHASRMALLNLTRLYYTSEFETVPVTMGKALEESNRMVFAESEANPQYAGMGTTVSAVVLLGDWAYIAQVGDSRVYLLRERLGIKQLTLDHSLVEEQVRNGLITPDEARTHSLKNLITRAVGIKDNVDVDLFALQLEPSDTLMLCSDGLCNMVPDSLISMCLSRGDAKLATQKLVEHALDNGGTDNVTVITLRVLKALAKEPYQRGGHKIKVPPTGFFKRLWRLFS